MKTAADKLARLISAATPENIERKRASAAAAKSEWQALESSNEIERARFARALYVKRLAALSRMERAATLRA